VATTTDVPTVFASRMQICVRSQPVKCKAAGILQHRREKLSFKKIGALKENCKCSFFFPVSGILFFRPPQIGALVPLNLLDGNLY
jgi:hypothetical protein